MDQGVQDHDPILAKLAEVTRSLERLSATLREFAAEQRKRNEAIESAVEVLESRMPNPPEILRPHEAARQLDIHPTTLARYRRSGKIRARKGPGKGYLYHRDDIRRLRAGILTNTETRGRRRAS